MFEIQIAKICPVYIPTFTSIRRDLRQVCRRQMLIIFIHVRREITTDVRKRKNSNEVLGRLFYDLRRHRMPRASTVFTSQKTEKGMGDKNMSRCQCECQECNYGSHARCRENFGRSRLSKRARRAEAIVDAGAEDQLRGER